MVRNAPCFGLYGAKELAERRHCDIREWCGFQAGKTCRVSETPNVFGAGWGDGVFST